MESSSVTRTSHTTTTVVSQQPMVGESRTVIVRNQVTEHDWSSGLCECHRDIKTCLLSFFCMPCFACYVASRQNEFACIPLCVPGGEIAMRTKLRTQENIRGSICDDCLKLIFCPCCALAQMSKELDHIEHKI
ncbi:placenta-specific gene 8 protein-like [Acanthaster planci]|uniref:Placenta-specific gene 8 protein-like n=1 Tax=Acanthaster planci TaxID=133434 RepID=A0A8B7ZSJ1_ACAPL|nr:placenta-specific gene 8 protein-like [Acanthaster planci]XP_022106436.1 placenta-specific gene 8 protein-like [Acanthaster planci]